MKPEVWRVLLLRALARCGSSTATAPLGAIANDARAPLFVRDTARLALSMVDPARALELARALYTPALPEGPDGDVPAKVRALETVLVDEPRKAREAILGLYLISAANPSARTLVLAIARVARLTGDEFGLLRALYGQSELKRDGELFAILARRFETLRAQPPRDNATLRYFRRRVARFLRQLGKLESPDYTKMAAMVLVSYRDSDAEAMRETGWGTWDAFARYHALNFVLFQNSPRYERASHHRATWRLRRQRQPGPSATREEAFPELWNRAPGELWRIGRSQAAQIVIEFAARALGEQTQFLTQLSSAELAEAMAEAHPLIRRVAFDSARVRTPDLTLARGALLCGLTEADDWVLEWVKRDPLAASANGELLALLITAPSAKVRDELVNLARATALAPSTVRVAATQAIAILLGLGEDEPAHQRAAGAVAVFLRVVVDALEAMDLQVARDLLAHALAPVAELGGEMVLRRASKAALPPGMLDLLLQSPHPSVRAIGARIVGETPPEILKDEPDVLILFALSANTELRQGTRRAIGEVARRYPDVGRLVADRLIDALSEKQAEGAPAHVVSLLKHELAGCLPRRDAKRILQLTSALSPHAREAGGLLLPQITVDEIALDDIVRLANNEIAQIRRGAWALAEAAKDRWKLAASALGRLCDARWQDSREFAFAFVQTLPLSPDAIISICDSTQPLVEAFGQRLLQERFRDEDSELYLLRLSEHPSANIQLLVSGLLVRHAHANIDALRRLLPFILTVLSRVNRGGVAKLRVLDFLRAESVASDQAAALLAPILERQSLTRAVSHRAPLIASMVALHHQHPEIPLPITIPTPPAHRRSARGV
jgi:hypothetical protein